ncbi:hypothetical protein M9H77_17357 [Catharanthus roseus]|uniref:Uncharacterized protein n=1 Tax=Catharanthus roseus TaxID=4058 RepID=A0ACC0B4D1_CATRO|nr:hypothetical protein M9H77_17357 [Catharanthus roseus]
MVRQLRRSYRWVAEEVAVGMMLGRSEQRREEEATIATTSAPHFPLSFSRYFCSSFSFKLQLAAAAPVENFRTIVPSSLPLLFPTRWKKSQYTCNRPQLLWRVKMIISLHLSSMLQKVDDMARGVIEGPPSSLTQIASFVKKVQTIIRRCMTWGKRGEGSGGCGHGDLGSSDHIDPFDIPDLDMTSFSLSFTPPTQSHPGGLGTSYAPPPSGLGFSSFQAPPPLGLGFSSFQAPPSPGTVSSSFQAHPTSGTVGSSTPHMPIYNASSSDSDERTDDATPAQQLGFGHRVMYSRFFL